MKKNILLAISFFLLITSIAIFGYLKYQTKNFDKELNELKENAEQVKDKIENTKKTKNDKENEYENLKEEVKENVEELNVWKELEEKLNTALS